MTALDAHRPSPPALRSPWPRAEAASLAREAYGRLAALVAGFEEDDWSRPTDCEGWTVRDLVGHLVGAMRSAASVKVQVAQQREAMRRTKRHGGQLVDHLTAVQVEQAAGLDTAELAGELRRLVDPATAGRRRIPTPLRRAVSFHVHVGALDERWPLGYFVDVILTRDAWLHRIDLCRAVGRGPELTGGHDGRIVADVAQEWAGRHGRPVALTLTGPAGGRFVTGGPEGRSELELDAVEFCRIVSGRAPGDGLLATEVPF